MKKVCSVRDCHSDVRCKSLCAIHYSRMKRNGTTEKLPPAGNKNKGAAHNRFRHGMTGTKTYKSWTGMIERCENPENKNYKNWGARGIRVCKEWRESFERFYDDMGERPDGLTIERVDVNGDYEPKNCKWASRAEQTRNRRYCKLDADKAERIREKRSNGMTFRQLSDEFGISSSHAKRVCDGKSWA